MGGQPVNCVAEILRRAMLCAGWVAIILACAAVSEGEEPTPGVRLRVTWGGGRPAARSGRIEVLVPGGPSAVPAWRLLSTEPGAVATMHESAGAIEIHEPRGLDLNGVELRLLDWRQARLRVAITGRESGENPIVLEGAVADLLAAPLSKPLDRDGNRLSISRVPGDELGVAFAAGESAIARSGGSVTLVVHPVLAGQAATGSTYELKVGARRSGSQTESHAQSLAVEEEVVETPGVRVFRPLRLAVPLPPEEGGCDIDLQLVERGGLRWSRPVATRTIQVVGVGSERPATPAADWKIVYEIDPGSPKLLERLRRMPGIGLPSLPMGGVPLPKLPRPSFTLPKMAIPTPALPNVPLPNVSLPGVSVPRIPSVTSMVPRLTGLLAVGHSTLESHALGPMLRLPPAGEGPAWEGVALPSGVPGMPHLVEVEYPLEQEMLLGLAVLEEADGEVRATTTSGIDLPAPVVDDGSRRGRIGTRRFVFWPRTRSPLLVITNLSDRSPAVFGRVRVLAGPMSVADHPPSPVSARRTYLHVPTPDFTPFGAVGRPATGGGAATDWDAFLGGIRRSADWAAAQGAAGLLVGVYADGAAVWPTARTHHAPRWDSGGGFDGRLDPEPKDLLALACRLYARERLRLVPAITCDGPMPALDGLLVRGGGDATGLVAVGRDGTPLVTEGGRCPHYNVLDPRVQAAVESLVGELVGRVQSAPTVDGIALLLPHDGWLHLPGVATGLDDVTFARFAAAAGPEVEQLVRPTLDAADPRRFASRSALVEGPLRERWLAWREAEVAAFHGRLAGIVATARPAWKFHLMPTTLFVGGRLAERFRPHLSDQPRDADVLREAGLDPALLTAHPGLVYVTPSAHSAADDGARDVAGEVNRSLALLRGAAGAARAGVLLLEQPRAIEVRDVIGQAGFTTKASGPVPVVAPAGGPEAGRALADGLIAVDPEVVFDAGLLHTCVDEEDERSRLAFTGLPPPPLEMVPSAAAPLAVRVREGEAGLWVSVVNACGIACQAVLDPARPPTAVADAVTKAAIPAGSAGEVTVPLGPWEVRTLLLEGCERVTRVRAVHGPQIAAAARTQLDDLEVRRRALEMPAPLAVLDNPSFELPELDGLVPGWELVEAGRGTLRRVTGKPSAGGSGLSFASDNGLATLRSNPFSAPPTGRISVAVWVRAGGPDFQPPLRIALEGLQDDREFYRFAAVGRGAGAMPLSAAWSQFVLQIDDLPTRGLESLRVRLDLLGPGAVEIDDVRVFDLAFDEAQRVRLSRILTVAAERAAAGDVGGCLVELDGAWPRFLRKHVAVPDVASEGRTTASAGVAPGPTEAPPARSGVVDRVRRWWQ